ncbi:MAG: hypothetical protein PHO01_06940 [Desulfotomaculaceae bacterium]|nr:hypothetical protein [Desulfotomaculaceae bacterium]
MQSTPELLEAVKKVSKDGRISCHEARKLANELNIPKKNVKLAADELKIKIYACELGCF